MCVDVLESKMCDTLFSNITSIKEMNKGLLADLEKRVAGTEEQCVGDVMKVGTLRDVRLKVVMRSIILLCLSLSSPALPA